MGNDGRLCARSSAAERPNPPVSSNPIDGEPKQLPFPLGAPEGEYSLAAPPSVEPGERFDIASMRGRLSRVGNAGMVGSISDELEADGAEDRFSLSSGPGGLTATSPSWYWLALGDKSSTRDSSPSSSKSDPWVSRSLEDDARVDDKDGEAEEPEAVARPPLSIFFAKFFSFARLFWNHTWTTQQRHVQ